MFHFPWLAFCLATEYPESLRGGFPHSGTAGLKVVRTYPTLCAAYHALHRLQIPRHPPCALSNLDPYTFRQISFQRSTKMLLYAIYYNHFPLYCQGRENVQPIIISIFLLLSILLMIFVAQLDQVEA